MLRMYNIMVWYMYVNPTATLVGKLVTPHQIACLQVTPLDFLFQLLGLEHELASILLQILCKGKKQPRLVHARRSMAPNNVLCQAAMPVAHSRMYTEEAACSRARSRTLARLGKQPGA